MSGGKAAMWTISGFIVVCTAVVLLAVGVSGMPGTWVGLIMAALFAVIAFALGYWE
jgi:hypothetical protein